MSSTTRHSDPLLVLSVRVPDSLFERLARMAQTEGRSLSALVRGILVSALMREDSDD